MQLVNFLEALAGNVRFTIFRSYTFSGHKSMHTGVTCNAPDSATEINGNLSVDFYMPDLF